MVINSYQQRIFPFIPQLSRNWGIQSQVFSQNTHKNDWRYFFAVKRYQLWNCYVSQKLIAKFEQLKHPSLSSLLSEERKKDLTLLMIRDISMTVLTVIHRLSSLFKSLLDAFNKLLIAMDHEHRHWYIRDHEQSGIIIIFLSFSLSSFLPRQCRTLLNCSENVYLQWNDHGPDCCLLHILVNFNSNKTVDQ